MAVAVGERRPIQQERYLKLFWNQDIKNLALKNKVNKPISASQYSLYVPPGCVSHQDIFLIAADFYNTSNQAAAANALASLPSTHALYQHIETLPAGTPAAVFSSLSGDTHSTVASSVNMLSAQAPNISQQHLRNNLTAGLRAGAPIAQSDGPLPASALPSSKALPAWVEVVGHWQKMDGNSNTPGVKQNTTGLFLGADEEVGGSGWRVGGSVGYTSANAKVSSRDASADSAATAQRCTPARALAMAPTAST